MINSFQFDLDFLIYLWLFHSYNVQIYSCLLLNLQIHYHLHPIFHYLNQIFVSVVHHHYHPVFQGPKHACFVQVYDLAKVMFKTYLLKVKYLLLFSHVLILLIINLLLLVSFYHVLICIPTVFKCNSIDNNRKILLQLESMLHKLPKYILQIHHLNSKLLLLQLQQLMAMVGNQCYFLYSKFHKQPL